MQKQLIIRQGQQWPAFHCHFSQILSQPKKDLWLAKQEKQYNLKSTYLRSIHQDYQPVIDCDDHVPRAHPALPGGARLHHLVHYQMESLVLAAQK